MSRVKEFFCVTCRKSEKEVESLKTCSRCRITQYCSASCQKRDFQAHKTSCYMINEFQNKMQMMVQMLENYKLPGSRKQNLYRSAVGEFSQVAPAENCPLSPLLVLQCNLGHAQIIWKLLDKHDAYRGISDVLDINLDVLRLDCYDSLRASQVIPFLFITLGRYQEAYDFLKFWISLPVRNKGELVKKAKIVGKGQWLHEPDQNMLENIKEVEFYPRFRLEKNATLHHLVAILALKLLLVDELMQKINEGEAFTSLVSGLDDGPTSILGKIKGVLPILDRVQAFVSGYSMSYLKRTHAQQIVQLEYLMELINKKNVSALPALVTPGPILAYGTPIDSEVGSPGEVADLLNSCWRIFQRIQGGRRFITDYLYPNLDPKGPFPPYPSVVDNPGLVF